MSGPEYFFVAMMLWAISLITFIAVRGLNWKHREKQIEARQAEQQLLLPQHPVPTVEQVQLLEERMRVLERIVTDRGYDLAHEIEALRGSQPARELERNG